MSGFAPTPGWACALLAALWLPALGAQNDGLPPEWEVRDSLSALVAQVQRLRPLMEAVKPEEWSRQGASETYQAQWKSIAAEVDYLARSAGELAVEPERLTLALETYFRMQSLDAVLDSLNEGVRKYQNPALADLIRGALTDCENQRQTLGQYILRLAAAKEQQFKVMDEEAQRCRSALSRQPPAPRSADRKAEAK